jgi:phosphoglycolate phosphatase-like HAD superfamily hydrolase
MISTHDKKERPPVQVARRPNESDAELTARVAIQPELNGAETVTRWLRFPKETSLTEFVHSLATQAEQVSNGDLTRQEGTLAVQTHTLDAIFNDLAQRAYTNIRAGHLEAGDMLLRLALRAQAQCTRTIQTLSELKNPPSVAFVRQANIANGPQQVNNQSSTRARARAEENQNQPIKQLEKTHDEWLDAGAKVAAVTSNPSMETVGAVYGTTNASREK